MYPIINAFGRELGTYGILAAVGLVLTGILAVRLGKKIFNIDIEDILLSCLACGAMGFIGAHLLFGITNISNMIEFSKGFSEMSLWEYISGIFNYFSGMVFYGGFIGGALGLYLFSKIYKPLNGRGNDLLDIFAVVFPLFHAFGRVGCFFAGCCYGTECEFGFRVDNNHINPSINGVTRFPVQLLEAALNLVIFLILYILIKKGKFRNILIYIYMIIYGTVRFLDEFLRGDEYRGFIFGISTSQFISLILIIYSVIYLMIRNRKNKKSPDHSRFDGQNQ